MRTEAERILRQIFGEDPDGPEEVYVPVEGETKSGREKQLEYHLTVGNLKELIADRPDDAPVFIERIQDSYFESGTGWGENSAFKSLEQDGYLQQFVQAYWAVCLKDDDAVYITPHY